MQLLSTGKSENLNENGMQFYSLNVTYIHYIHPDIQSSFTVRKTNNDSQIL